MLTEDLKNVSAIIDPFNCSYADREYDLYQLDNANGKEFGLLNNYCKKYQISENFVQKRAFYELFTELNHYYDAKHEIPKEFIANLAGNLKKFI